MGAHGASVVPDTARVLTHCNAGALATAGYGTALGVIRGAVEAGKKVAVFADETRPFLQGSRLTAWELTRDGIDTTVITDNMSGAMMQRRAGRSRRRRRRSHRRQRRRRQQDRHVHGCGAGQRARHSRSTSPRRSRRSIWRRRTARTIPIEERNAKEVTHLGPTRLTPAGRARPQPRVRRHAEQVRDGHHHRARHRPRPVHRVACRSWSTIKASDPFAGMLILGIETSCDETSAAVVSETGRRLVDRLEHRRVAGRDPSRMGRRRSRAGVAAAHPRHLRRRPHGARHGAHVDLDRPRRRRRHAGTRPCGLAAGRRVVCEVSGGVAGSSARARPPPGRPYRIALSSAWRRCHCRWSCSSCPAATRACTWSTSPARTSGSAGRGMMPRARHTTRSPSSSGSAIRAVRSSTRAPRRETTRRSRFRRRG